MIVKLHKVLMTTYIYDEHCWTNMKSNGGSNKHVVELERSKFWKNLFSFLREKIRLFSLGRMREGKRRIRWMGFQQMGSSAVKENLATFLFFTFPLHPFHRQSTASYFHKQPSLVRIRSDSKLCQVRWNHLQVEKMIKRKTRKVEREVVGAEVEANCWPWWWTPLGGCSTWWSSSWWWSWG